MGGAFTREEYQSYLERFVMGQPLAAMALRSVMAHDIATWLTWVRGGTGPTMAARVYGLVSSVFNAAVKDALIDRSPCTIRGASSAPRASAKAIATPQEVAALMEHVGERYRALVLLAAWSGLRSGELRNLRRRHVDRREADPELGIDLLCRPCTWALLKTRDGRLCSCGTRQGALFGPVLTPTRKAPPCPCTDSSSA